MRKFCLSSPISTGRLSLPSNALAPSAMITAAHNSIHVNAHQMRKQNAKFQDTVKPTEYDFDKERWSKQMRMTSMECVVQPEIEFASQYTFSGARRKFGQYFAMKKLQDRFPKFTTDDMKPIYEEYKRLVNDNTQDDERKLLRVTTHAEALRLSKERRAKVNQNFAKKSWKAMKISEQSSYGMSIEKFEIINIFYGNMAKEDWVQLTCKCTMKERFKSNEEYQEILEYPVFEANVGDGMRAPTMADFHIVAIMNEDGLRYGKDGDNAAEVRKGLTQKKGWFW